MPYCHVKGDIPPFATLTVDPDDGPTFVDTAGEDGKIDGMVWFFRNTNARLFLDDQGWSAAKNVTLNEETVVDVSIKSKRPAGGGGGGNGNVMILGREEQVPAGTPPNTVIVRKV